MTQNQYQDRYIFCSAKNSKGRIETNTDAGVVRVTYWTGSLPELGDDVQIFSVEQLIPETGVGRGWGSNAYINYGDVRADCMNNFDGVTNRLLVFDSLVDFGTPSATSAIPFTIGVRPGISGQFIEGWDGTQLSPNHNITMIADTK